MDKPSLEQRIAAQLWRWSNLREDQRAPILSVRSELAGCIEYYLCAVFREAAISRRQGWWCDGLAEYSLAQPAPNHFVISGVAYWGTEGPFFLAPFEVEFRFATPEDDEPQTELIKFGMLDSDGDICRTPVDSANVEKPDGLEEWAMAVERSSIR